MDITVLAKVVSDRATLEPQPPHGLARREEGSSFLNPFDQRALRAAVELRRPGERVTIVSMGPAYAERILAPYRGAGVDRILLLSDEALRGADLVLTARALAGVLKPLGRQIILTGDRATDSEVGALAAAISPHLWFPALAGVRSIVRDEDGVGLTVTLENETGWARWTVRAPCILSVGEKVARPLKPPSEAGADLAGSVEKVDLSWRPEPGEHAPVGSPRTRIVRWDRLDRARQPRLFDGPSRDSGLAVLKDILDRTAEDVPPSPSPTAGPARPGAHEREVLVLATGEDGGLDLRALAALDCLARTLPGFWLSAVWAGPHPGTPVTEQIATAGAARGYGLHGPRDPVPPVVATLALERVLDRRPATAAIVVADSTFGRQVAGRLAARLDRGIVTGVEEAEVSPEGTVLFRKPSFGHRYSVTVAASPAPAIGLFRATPRSEPVPTRPGSLDWIDTPFEVPSVALHRVDHGAEVGPEYGDLERTEVVVGVGMGLGGPDRVQALLPKLRPAHAALAATRRVVDAGWVPPQLQVGLTGRSIRPRLGILVGVSGSVHQMVGWRRARTLVAINSDPTAAVFSQVDVGFVGRWEEVLPSVLDLVAASR